MEARDQHTEGLWSAKVHPGRICPEFGPLDAAPNRMPCPRNGRSPRASVAYQPEAWPGPRSRLDVRTVARVAGNVMQFVASMLRSRAHLAAENLFLRKELALYVERHVKPRRADDATRVTLAALSRLIDRRRLLTVVKPETLIR